MLAKSYSFLYKSINLATFALSAKSILFIIRIVLRLASFILSKIILSPFPISSEVASITNTKTSTSFETSKAFSTITSPNFDLGL